MNFFEEKLDNSFRLGFTKKFNGHRSKVDGSHGQSRRFSLSWWTFVENNRDLQSKRLSTHHQFRMVSFRTLNNFIFIFVFSSFRYISILVELTRLEGTKHGNLISLQVLDVAVRVESIREFACHQMVTKTNLVMRKFHPHPQFSGNSSWERTRFYSWIEFIKCCWSFVRSSLDFWRILFVSFVFTLKFMREFFVVL